MQTIAHLRFATLAALALPGIALLLDPSVQSNDPTDLHAWMITPAAPEATAGRHAVHADALTRFVVAYDLTVAEGWPTLRQLTLCETLDAVQEELYHIAADEVGAASTARVFDLDTNRPLTVITEKTLRLLPSGQEAAPPEVAYIVRYV